MTKSVRVRLTDQPVAKVLPDYTGDVTLELDADGEIVSIIVDGAISVEIEGKVHP